MRIHFVMAGGLAGPAMKRSCTVDANALSQSETGELQQLIDSADVAALAARGPAQNKSPRPDEMHYRLVIEAKGQQHTIEASDTDMPTHLSALVSWLTKRATPRG